MRQSINIIRSIIMLMKIQHHRMSRDWTIIEGAKNVIYSDHPIRFGTLEKDQKFEREYFEKNPHANTLIFREESGTPVWSSNGTYFVNELSFLNDQGYLEKLIFDGEAYICNNDGKTVQQLLVRGHGDRAIAGVGGAELDQQTLPEEALDGQFAVQHRDDDIDMLRL